MARKNQSRTKPQKAQTTGHKSKTHVSTKIKIEPRTLTVTPKKSDELWFQIRYSADFELQCLTSTLIEHISGISEERIPNSSQLQKGMHQYA